MPRTPFLPRLPFLALALFLAALPAALFKPGLPLALKGDEATHLGLAWSLLVDHDLAFSAADAERVFGAFPFDPDVDFRLLDPRGEDQDPGGRRFDAPLLYPLVAAPLLALLGSNGLLVANLLLLAAAIWLIVLFLARRGLTSPLFFAAPFVLLSPALIYAFWMRPSALLFLLGTLAATEGWVDERPLPRWRRAAAGAALGLAAAHLPFLLLLAAPLLWRMYHAEKRSCAAFALALVAGFGLLAGLHLAMLDQIFPGKEGRVYTLEKAGDEPWRSPSGARAEPAPRPFTAERLACSLIERRRGFLPYFPLAILALCLWRAPRRRELWPLATLAAAILAQPWVGELDPGLPMNPALLPLYPVFVLFVGSIPSLAVVAGASAATYLLGLQLFGLLGSPIPDGGAHGHVRAWPFSRLPLDVEEIQPGSGLVSLELSGDDPSPRLWAAADQALLGGRELWTYGGERVELFLESRRPLTEILLQVRSLAAPNRIELRHRGGEEIYDFQEPPAISQRRLRLAAGEPTTRGSVIYRLEISSQRGAKPYWAGESEVGDYIGAAIAYIGTPEEIGRDLYHVEWLACGYPETAVAGKKTLALVRARNRSAFPWPSRGASRIRFASRWLDAEGNKLAENPGRSAILHPAAPGAEVRTWLDVRAPETPGNYLLEFDAVYENVGWFSAKNAETCRQAVEVR